ncbi:hypothetical protein Tco_1132177 [Tanacetum coccineum]|uniref:Uncharacterized protein n=1 Tax=Tanacetum coccineum TaxID=301880 RepID=A0ABQ5JBU9_9ASTR
MATMAENVITAGSETQWSRFVTAAKKERDLHVVNFDQLYAFLKHNEKKALGVGEMRQRFPNPLALLANTYNPPPSYNTQDFLPRITNSELHPIQEHNYRGEGHIAKQCTAKKRVKDAEWLEENDDGDDLQLHTTTNFKADHVDAYDSDCDDQATTNAIFMASLSSAGSLNDDTVTPTYDSNTLSEVPHYDTYHDDDMLNSVVQETEYNDHFVSHDDSYVELTSDGTKPKSEFILKVVEKNDLSKTVTSHLTTKKITEKCTKVLASGHASKFVERIQELLVYVSASCPFTESRNEKWAPATYHKKNNMPYVDASRSNQIVVNNTKKHPVKQNTQKTDNSMLPSTGRVSSTDASESKLRSNTKNDRIQRPSRRSKKNKVEVQPRKYVSSSNKNNLVTDYVQKRKKAKSVKQKEKKQWKPTGRVFTSVGLRWKPIGRIFNMTRKICPIIKTSPATIIPLGNRLHTIRIPDIASNAETRIRYSIAKNSLIRAHINSYGHPFNPPNFAFVRNSTIPAQSS